MSQQKTFRSMGMCRWHSATGRQRKRHTAGHRVSKRYKMAESQELSGVMEAACISFGMVGILRYMVVNTHGMSLKVDALYFM